MILSLITNNPLAAKNAEIAGIERMMIDLETFGKQQRQLGRNLYHSDHQISDVYEIKKVLSRSEVVVRINSIHEHSKNEIDSIVNLGADRIMLPYFKSIKEVEILCTIIDNRVKIILLLETIESLQMLNDLIRINRDFEFHFGLNDLSINLNWKSIFQPFYDDSLLPYIDLLKQNKLNFGIGGIGAMSNSSLSIESELILAEQIRLGCNLGWMGRSFRNHVDTLNVEMMQTEINLIRDATKKWQNSTSSNLTRNKMKLNNAIKNWESTI
jgi:citrate lyase beta subunit